jgi:hypothetical protein
MEPKGSLLGSQEPRSSRPCATFHNKLLFYGEELLAPHPNPKLEDNPLLAVHNSLLNIFTDTLQPQLEDTPCCGNRDPLNMVSIMILALIRMKYSQMAVAKLLAVTGQPPT